ncbi:MAG: phosphatase PAP2 family protein [bacterium]
MKKIIYISAAFLIILSAIYFLNLDLKIAYLFYKPGNPFWDSWSKNPVWVFSYKYGTVLPNLIGAVAFIVLIAGFFVSKLKEWRKRCIFAVLLLALAPGLIVQTLKETWGRPRPIELKIFNGSGDFEYRSPFNPNINVTEHDNDGNAFPSGHAAIGFYVLVLYFVFNRRTYLLLAGLAYGGFMSFGRMAQGGHFLSDVLTSLFIVYITAEALSKIMAINKKQI